MADAKIVNGVILQDRDYLMEKWKYFMKLDTAPGWGSLEEFLAWSKVSGYEPGKSLLRKDKRKPHGPTNCYWRWSDFGYRGGLLEDQARAKSWNKTVNKFRRALGLPLFPED
jgi:hypothetical protein